MTAEELNTQVTLKKSNINEDMIQLHFVHKKIQEVSIIDAWVV